MIVFTKMLTGIIMKQGRHSFEEIFVSFYLVTPQSLGMPLLLTNDSAGSPLLHQNPNLRWMKPLLLNKSWG